MAEFRKVRLTLTVVNAMQPGEIVHDTDLKGFGARRQVDSVSYFLRTRVAGRQKLFTIGRHGRPWTVQTARDEALKLLADPHKAAKPDAPAVAQAFAEVAEMFLNSHGKKLKPRTLEEYSRLVRLYLVPSFGKTSIRELTRAQVATAHGRWHENPRAANHALAVLSKMISWAEGQGLREEGPNPCRRIDKFRENKREDYLTDVQLGALGQALAVAEAENLLDPFALAAIRLLILTGARLSEILTLRWKYVDLERRKLLLPDAKAGKKTIELNDAAIAVLETVPHLAGNPFVIVGGNEGHHLVNLQKPWRKVRGMAGLDGVRIHDLRHTFASKAVASGGSLPIIGRMLGHRQPVTTARYAHLSDDPVAQLSQSTGTALAEALKGKPKA